MVRGMNETGQVDTDDTRTVNATEFKTKCLGMLDRIDSDEWDIVAITKRGKVVAMLVPPPPPCRAKTGLRLPARAG